MSSGFLIELRRRRVFNTVAIYVAGAWIALQVGEQAFPALDIAERAIRYIWMGAFLLFPLVLVFGWRYDISKEGISRTAAKDAANDTDTSLKYPDRWFIGILSVLALTTIGSMLFEISRVEPENMVIVIPQENSIAVIPFDVCEDRASDVTLAGGLTGEVIGRLAQRDRLKVIGRATSFNLASVGSSTQEVSALTKTQYVLTGTLCRDGFQLRLDAKLTGADGFIVWRESFTEVTNQFDQVEKRLAQLVANGVALELGDVIKGTPDSPVNRLALEQLLIGQEYSRQGAEEKARTAFEQALEYQPEFAEAVWELAYLELDAGSLENEGSSIENAWPLAEQALELALAELEHGVPDFKAHWIAGRILHTLARLDEKRIWRNAVEFGEEEVAARQQAAKRQFLEAEQHFRSAMMLNPSASEVRGWLATNLRRQGVHRSGEALEIMLEGWNYDPFNPQFGRNLADQLASRGQYQQAMEVLDRFEALPQGKRPLYWLQLETMNNYARYDDKLATLIEILDTDPEGMDWETISHLWWTASEIALLVTPEEAEVLHGQVERIPYPEESEWVTWARETFMVESYLWATGRRDEVVEKKLAEIAGMSNEEILDAWYVKAGMYASAIWDAGQKDRAIELFESLRHVQHAPLWAERQTGGTLSLAGMYIEVGRPDDAKPLLEEAVAHLEEEFAAGIRHPQTLGLLAEAYALLGNDEIALEMLGLALNYGEWFFVIEMELPVTYETPWWERLKDDPRFIQSVNRAQSIREQQATNVHSLLSQNDMDTLLAQLIEAVERRLEE